MLIQWIFFAVCPVSLRGKILVLKTSQIIANIVDTEAAHMFA